MIRSEKFSTIREIADAIGTQTATPEQEKQLAQLLRGNIEAQQFFYDYMSMHAHLLTSSDHNLEFSYKRKTETAVTEEFVVRRKNTSTNIKSSNSDNEIAQERLTEPDDKRHVHAKKLPLIVRYKLWLMLTAVILLLLLFWQQLNQNSMAIIAKIEQGHLSIVGQGMIDGEHLFSGEYQTDQTSNLLLVDDDVLHLTAHSNIRFFNNHEMQLTQGKLSLKPTSENNIIVHGPNFTLHSNGSEFSIDLTQGNPVVNSGKNTVLIPIRWQPKHFWTFDGQSDRVIDSVGTATGIPAPGATRTTGLLGQGAFVFDNTANARIDVGSGGGTAPATGSFSVTDGVTIEALIRPEFTGSFKAIDAIFRKDRGDGELRMLLSFQHDQGKNYLRPEGQFNESLSFGLYIVGQGYHELKLPLDGLEGRPTLAQLKQDNFHHIVANYNVPTGLKAIYINGELLASYQYPPGSKILSGGPGQASIGNNPAESRWAKEAFSGIIDEVAFYDFALPPLLVDQHLKYVRQGQNYFNLPPSVTPLPKTIKLSLPDHSTIELDSLTGLPLHLIKQ